MQLAIFITPLVSDHLPDEGSVQSSCFLTILFLARFCGERCPLSSNAVVVDNVADTESFALYSATFLCKKNG